MAANLTPMMRQYFDAKSKFPDCILFFRMGDFYEVFFDDAKTAAAELELTLTARDKDKENPVPMAGMPHHAAESYIRRLVDRGYHVAICEQLQDPKDAQGIVERGVTRVVTPGTMLDEGAIEAKENNFLAAVAVSSLKNSDTRAFACVDVSTGELRVCELTRSDDLEAELRRSSPAEVIVGEEQAPLFESLLDQLALPWSVRPNDALALKKVVRSATSSPLATDARGIPAMSLHSKDLEDRLSALDAHTFRDRRAVESAVGLLFEYLIGTRGGVPAIIGAPDVYRSDAFLVLDPASSANLEIFETLMGGRKKGSLFSQIDLTVTAAGGRRLRTWLAYPLKDVTRIQRRQDAVSALVASVVRRDAVRAALRGMSDIQRVTSKLAAGQGNARDLVTLAETLSRVPVLVRELDGEETAALANLRDGLDPCDDIAMGITEAIEPEPPVAITEGGVIRRGYDPELDRLIGLTTDGKKWLLEFEATQREETGIASLKVKHNKVFGYYIEVTKANLEHVPDHYVRKQTLVNAERYFTPELKEYEEDIIDAQERRNQLEYQLFERVRESVIAELSRLRATAEKLAELDALSALAELAHKRRFTAPRLVDERRIEIEEGRHPVVEAMVEGGRFVPNDTRLDDEATLLIITGPNMAGKSTVIRQVALITLLAQIGSHVPAKQATIGVVDQIFSRVGASDNLARGQSTFMVEMSEAAHILRNATDRSLVILDEIGRGTSTYDGLSIAWAVAEHLHDNVGALTLFATHYHELTQLSRLKPGVHNFNILAKEYNEDIVFLHKLAEGPANRSYGIQVARLAGVPEAVVDRAREVLENLEASQYEDDEPVVGREHSDGMPVKRPQPQLSLFGERVAPVESAEDPVRKELAKLPLDTLSPIEALNTLYRLQKRARKRAP